MASHTELWYHDGPSPPPSAPEDNWAGAPVAASFSRWLTWAGFPEAGFPEAGFPEVWELPALEGCVPQSEVDGPWPCPEVLGVRFLAWVTLLGCGHPLG